MTEQRRASELVSLWGVKGLVAGLSSGRHVPSAPV